MEIYESKLDISNPKYNQARKNILSRLDKDIEVSNLELGFYDLTAHYKKENMNMTLVEKILFYQNSKRKIQHIKKEEFYFTPEQVEALECIKNNNRIIVSAPTSFGKTLIVKEYIFLNKFNKIVFIVPTNALAYELEKSFKENESFSEYQIFDKKKNIDDFEDGNKLLFIGTQEKYLEIKDSIQNVDLFVIDEAYKLEESTKQQRAYKLSKTFLEAVINNSNQVILLSPNAKFQSFDIYKFKLYETFFNSVDKHFHKISDNNFYELLNEKSNKEKTIMYCDTPSDFEDVEKHINIKEVQLDDRLIQLLESEFHSEWTIVKLLKKGILSHNGAMPKFLQNKMINLFLKNKNFNLLIGTNSISEGINTPTKNLFIKPGIKTSNKLLIKNTIGRAGRLGEFPLGHIYFHELDKIEDINNETIEIKLGIGEEDNLNELIETNDDTKVLAFCEKNNITKTLYDVIVSKYKISMKIFQNILDMLREDLIRDGIRNLPFMVNKVFKDETINARDDSLYIRGLLQEYYYDENNSKIWINTFNDRVKFFKLKSKSNYSNSKIIDGYMKFLYSVLDYKVCPIVNITKEILELKPDFTFGNNVVKTIKDFSARYHKKILGINDFDEYSENEKSICLTLKEYGISIKSSIINREMLKEIESKLNNRYSTYDILKKIKYLSEHSDRYKNSFKLIVDQYID